MIIRTAILTLLSLFSGVSFGAGALNWYASQETEKEIAASEITTVISFNDAASVDKIKHSGDITTIAQVKLPGNIDNGAYGIKVLLDDTTDGKAGGRSSITLPIDKPIDLSESRALVFNYHVSEKLSNYFLGRYDIRATINNSKMMWTIPAVKPNWQIGIPDGGAEEYKNGNNYHMWDNCLRYNGDFPNDVHYTVGKSDWTKDWNYMHPGTPRVEGAPLKTRTTWTIDFDLDKLPKDHGLLTIMVGGRSAKTQVFVNDKKVGDLNGNIGTQHIRSVPYGQQVLKKYQIGRDVVTKGKNTIEITYDLGRKDGEKAKKAHASRTSPGWMCYDFLRFEVQ